MTPEAIREEYGQINDLLHDFGGEVINQICHAVRDRGIKLAFPAVGRVKELESVILKVAEGKFTPNVSITEMQDLASFRLVTLYKSEIPAIIKVIESIFPDHKRYNTRDRFGNDQFGYSSLHFVVSPPNAWKWIPYLSRFSGLLAEIQVRTLSEHIWAECSHSLNYKSSLNVPPGINRPLHRLSALLEVVESELDQIKQAHHLYKESVDKLEIADLLKEDLNVLTFKKLLVVVLADFKSINDDQYAALDKTVEKDFDVGNLPYLFEVINKYIKQVPTDQGLDQKQTLEIILSVFKANNYS